MASLILTFGETREGNCLACGTETVLVTTDQWDTHYADDQAPDDDPGYVLPAGEVSGHHCPECNVMTAVFVHTPYKI